VLLIILISASLCHRNACLPVTVPRTKLNERHIKFKYGLKRYQEGPMLKMTMKGYDEWSSEAIRLDRFSGALQSTSLAKHDDHIRGGFKLSCNYNGHVAVATGQGHECVRLPPNGHAPLQPRSSPPCVSFSTPTQAFIFKFTILILICRLFGLPSERAGNGYIPSHSYQISKHGPVCEVHRLFAGPSSWPGPRRQAHHHL
jgi:hypothetical protein